MSFKKVQGQAPALNILKGLLKTRRLPPALLFYGPEGVGKTIAAMEFAKALNCTAGEGESLFGGAEAEIPCDQCPSCLAAEKGIDLDLKRLNTASQAMLLEEEPEKQLHIKVESIRHLIKDIEMRSLMGRWKTAIVEDAHKMLPAAANALLKALEEPPPSTLWILVTAHREQLLPTILSRCHPIQFHPLPQAIVESILVQRGMNAQEAAELSKLSEGSPGKSLEIQRNPLPDPASWVADPLGPLRLAEKLPRELHLTRPIVESWIQQMAGHLRMRLSGPALRQWRVRKKFRELESLKRALRANADPRLVLQSAAMEFSAP